MKYCTKCGKRLEDSSKFCTQCGAVFSSAKTEYLSFRAPASAGMASLGEFGMETAIIEEAEEIIEDLSPVRSILRTFASFFKGIWHLFTKPKNLITIAIVIAVWFVMNILMKYTSIPMEIPSAITYAHGGLDRSSIIGAIGGVIGKGTVAALIVTLVNGGFKRIGSGIKNIFKGTGEKRSIVCLIIGTVISALLYFLFVGFKTASIYSVAVGVSGILLSLQAVGGKTTAVHGLASSLTARKGRAQSLLSGMALGFAVATALSVILTPHLVFASGEDDEEPHWERVGETRYECQPDNGELTIVDDHELQVCRGEGPNDNPKEKYYFRYTRNTYMSTSLMPGDTMEMSIYSGLMYFHWYVYRTEPEINDPQYQFTAEGALAHIEVSMSGEGDTDPAVLRETQRRDIDVISSPFVNVSNDTDFVRYWGRGAYFLGGEIYYELTVPEGHPGDTMTVTEVYHYGDIRGITEYVWVDPNAEVPADDDDDIEEEVTTEAERRRGEDRGTNMNPGIVDGIKDSGIPEDAATAGGGALIGGGIAGILEENERKKKKKDKKDKEKQTKRSNYRMYVNKDFGNTLRRGEDARMVYARIAELPEGGGELSRDDLSANIEVFSGDGVLEVSDGGIVNGYRCAVVKVPDDCKAMEGSVSFRFKGAGGTFTRHVVFSILAGEILFPQENLGLPACKLKYVKKSAAGGSRIGDGVYVMPFYVKDMPQGSVVNAVFERVGSTDMNGKYIDKSQIKQPMPYMVTVEPDKEYGAQGIFNAVIKEAADYELGAGISEGFALKVTAEYGKPGQAGYDIATGFLPVYRIHMGLAFSVQAKSIPCYIKLKPGCENKNKDELQPEDYEIVYSEGSLILFLCDEADLSVIRIPMNPEQTVKVTATKVENDRYCRTGDANATHQQTIDKLGICAFPTGVINDNGSHKIKLCSTLGWLDPPTRILADIEISAKYDGKTYTAVKNVLLRSQDFRIARNADDDRKFLERDKHITEQLLRISEKIEHQYPLNLFSLKNMIDRMLEGYDSRFGYDENQLQNVMDMWTGFLEGSFAGANGTPQGITFADELKAVYAFMQGLRDNTGLLGRVAMGVMTSGVSEYVFTTMTVAEKMQQAVFRCKGDKDFGFWDGVQIGVEEFGKQILMEMAMQKGMKLVGNTYLSPDVTIADKLAAFGKGYRNGMNAADKFLKENVSLYKMGDDALQSCKNFFNSSAGAAKSAIDETVRAEENSIARAEELLKKNPKDLSPEMLKEYRAHEKGMENGMEKLRDLYKAQREMNATTDPVALKAAKAKYRQAADRVWDDKYALRQLQRTQHSDGDLIRAQFNHYRESLLDEVQLEALDDICRETGIRRENLYVMNASNGSKVKIKSGKKVPSDRDVSFKQKVLSDRSRDLTIDQEMGRRAVARRLFKKMNGREAESIEEALEFMKSKDVTYVNPEKSAANSHVFEHNLEGYEDLAGMTGIKPDGSMDKGLMKNDLHNKVINQASVREKGVEWFRSSDKKLSAARAAEAEAASLSGQTKELKLMEADNLRIKAESDNVEGVYQITKQVENIIIPRGVMRTGKNPIPPEAMDLHQLALRVGYDVSPAQFKMVLKETYNMDLNGYAEYMSKFLD